MSRISSWTLRWCRSGTVRSDYIWALTNMVGGTLRWCRTGTARSDLLSGSAATAGVEQ
ncbi:hypothetical protein ACFVUN_05580 [Kitasatospora griseola]|uniref:hypothetical protein n=1 Tax=Kitasatospora griseola TaxID=2064 RepID=UPI0036D8644E